MSTTFDFTGRTVLVTGAARGIGLAVRRCFAEAGATTVVGDVAEAGLAAATTGVLEDAIPLVLDVSDVASVSAGVDHLLSATGRLDVVVNNAGILRDRVVWKLTDEDWQAVLGVH